MLVGSDSAARLDALRHELLTDGYDPRMEAVHRRNAAWLVLQHAIGEPPLQRRGPVPPGGVENEGPRSGRPPSLLLSSAC
jgi:hypothetical protein